MAKSSKRENEEVPARMTPTGPGLASIQLDGPSKPMKQPKVLGTSRKSAKTLAEGKSAEKTQSDRKSGKEAAISDDQIRIRAYFISEQRVREGIVGNSTDDWLEARRQLQAEVEKRPANA
jgi:hypothetical protein